MARGRRGSAIHRGLVGERKLVGTPYLADAVLRDEYARDIAPRTEAALGRVLDEVWGAMSRAYSSRSTASARYGVPTSFRSPTRPR